MNAIYFSKLFKKQIPYSETSNSLSTEMGQFCDKDQKQSTEKLMGKLKLGLKVASKVTSEFSKGKKCVIYSA